MDVCQTQTVMAPEEPENLFRGGGGGHTLDFGMTYKGGKGGAWGGSSLRLFESSTRFVGWGGWHTVLVCVPLAVPLGLSPLLILTLCGPERVLVVINGAPG